MDRWSKHRRLGKAKAKCLMGWYSFVFQKHKYNVRWLKNCLSKCQVSFQTFLPLVNYRSGSAGSEAVPVVLVHRAAVLHAAVPGRPWLWLPWCLTAVPRSHCSLALHGAVSDAHLEVSGTAAVQAFGLTSNLTVTASAKSCFPALFLTLSLICLNKRPAI